MSYKWLLLVSNSVKGIGANYAVSQFGLVTTNGTYFARIALFVSDNR